MSAFLFTESRKEFQTIKINEISVILSLLVVCHYKFCCTTFYDVRSFFTGIKIEIVKRIVNF